MAVRRTMKDTFFVVLAWLIAAALVYLIIIKLKLLFH
jgi:hypothetical protein